MSRCVFGVNIDRRTARFRTAARIDLIDLDVGLKGERVLGCDWVENSAVRALDKLALEDAYLVRIPIAVRIIHHIADSRDPTGRRRHPAQFTYASECVRARARV